MRPAKVVGVVYNARAPAAKSMVKELVERLNLGDRSWVEAAADVDSAASRAEETDLIITVGGDGTILRAAKLAVPHKIPILGINLGRLGFMTELRAEEALEKTPSYLEGAGWLEERSMLQVQVTGRSIGDVKGLDARNPPAYHALNDAVLGQRAVARLMRVEAWVDGAQLASYRADAVIVCTATGSTGYSLSAGGPILHPQAQEMILKPVAPHVGMAAALVLPPTSTVELAAESDHEAMLSVDGYVDLTLALGGRVKIQQSLYKALFLRGDPPQQFYATLARRFRFDGNRGADRDVP